VLQLLQPAELLLWDAAAAAAAAVTTAGTSSHRVLTVCLPITLYINRV
jgi:hypothetical protein